MTSRERVLTSCNHQEPDRVPIDFGGHRSSGIMALAYRDLRKALGLPDSPLYVYDFIQQLAIVEDDLLDLFGVDVVDVGYLYYKNEQYWKDWVLPDGTPCKIPAFIEVEKTEEGWIVRGDEGQPICIQRPGCLYFEQCYFPLLDNPDQEFERLEYYLKQIMWFRLGTPPAPAGFDPEGLKIHRENTQKVRSATDRAIYATFGGNLLETAQFAFRMDNFLTEIALNPRRVHRFLDKLVEYHLGNLEKYLDAVGPYVDIIGFGDDLGMQTGPQISPKMYREFFKPRHALLWQTVKKKYPRLKVALHCCGSIYQLLPDLIEAGLDIIQPVQIAAKDMEPERLKREFGKDIVFWGGGCDTQTVLPFGTPQEVREHVRNNLRIFAPSGGYVFQQVHNIMAGVPPQNIIAMFEEVRNFKY
ncbi:MAG: methyltransferase [Candidatus Atribacteria bacterium]|nr:methyltransferase [Candidatus Atribacteria bacterium]MCD6350323.1 methyltransferase [Candidatus Atribacteria bacterium]